MKNYIPDITEIPNDISNDINIKEIYGTIYLYVNMINFKKYVGQTINKDYNGFRCSWKINTLKSYNDYLYYAFKKYKIKNFKKIIIDYVDFENKEEWELKQELTIKEGLWMYYLNTLDCNFGYNLKEPGIHGKQSKETKEKLSKIGKKRYEDPNERKRTSIDVKKAYKNDPSMIEKIKKTHTGRKRPKKTGIRISKAQKKRYEDPNARLKTALSQIKRYEDPNERIKTSKAVKKAFNENHLFGQKISMKLKGKSKSKEHKDNLSIAQNKRFENPKEHEKLSKSQQKRYNNPEEIKKLSKSHSGKKYFCNKCVHKHTYNGKIGKKHIKYKKINYLIQNSSTQIKINSFF